jgi:hypothetical protein
MQTFSEFLHAPGGIEAAKGKRFIIAKDVLGEFSHISEGYSAIFHEDDKVHHVPILVEGKENKELRIIRLIE